MSASQAADPIGHPRPARREDGTPHPPPSLAILGAAVEGTPSDILVAGASITQVLPAGEGEAHLPAAARRIDGRGRAALPGLMNAHTHTAMAMLRSFADDMPLLPWLREKIWPLEAKLDEEDVYWGARLGCLEMIRTGTTFFNDMYWHFDATARAAADSGMRALVGGVIIDQGDSQRDAASREAALAAIEHVDRYGSRVRASLAPHAIYTVGEDSLRWVAATAAERGLPVHIHLSETAHEVADCVAAHGMRPPAWLAHVGLLDADLFAAHCVHLDDTDIGLLAERGVHPLHNPVSNLKLASGGPMPYRAMREAGLRVLIGTDGAASNNNLDLLEELKFAALMAKHASGDPTAMTARQALAMATRDAALAFGFDGGHIAPGAVADLILVDLDHPLMFPGHDLAADLVYSAHGRAVCTTICDGRVLMDDGRIADEETVRAEVRERLTRLMVDG